ncbi:MAG: hypothetical protein GW762_04715 [Candidatus Pacebacteria bacterium]|nr:hypothetical protein [Candidatus Paceibacterota bacterium]PIR64177.1 MAG: hypothetical protein COU64_00475 [Candidatus Pacebacteria bacterium CG10_big_fil_rev_8_21_14_0_10_40_26]PIZ79299.1 MAG: hypothetical protein COY01_02645 [Candidatus Pacebacteria bacterium CG_4_10_14_0_2_um_filter_40_20]PJA68955.1 MAG: hypothetical protein CO156_03255 [Candidatus Pacebacteria bacterium CG_4_9_14_3_um_filter_40_12]PJC42266.1 MAG: hypothetical protein CO041_01355 [Candidatus Pacebacteria bacterium CG_4_9_
MKKTESEFLEKLHAEAAFQHELFSHRVLPSKVDVLTSFIGTHSWQTFLFLALVTSIVLEVIEKW